MKTGAIIGLSALGLLAIGGGIYLGTRKKTTEEKKADLTKTVQEATGDENKAARVAEMSPEEVDTVYDTLSPDGGGGGGGGGSSYSPPASSTPYAPATTPTTTIPKAISIRTIPNAQVMPAPTTQTRANTPSTIFTRPTTRPTTLVPKTFVTAVKRPVMVTKRGVGSVDASNCAEILRKYGIL